MAKYKFMAFIQKMDLITSFISGKYVYHNLFRNNKRAFSSVSPRSKGGKKVNHIRKL